MAADQPRVPYQLIFEALGQLAEQQAGWATIVDYGTTPGGRGLRLIKIQRPEWSDGTRERPAALIMGALHGDEYLAIEDRLAAWFLKHRNERPGIRRFLASGGILYIAPVTNPDGYDRDRRANNNGVDLNRDFALLPENTSGFREPETRSLASWLEQELYAANARLKLSVDYHCCNGSLLYPWSYRDAPLPADVMEAHARIGRLMQQDIDPKYAVGPTGKILGYHARGTSKDYFHAKYGALAFTYEGKARNAESGLFARHALWWDHVLELLVE